MTDLLLFNDLCWRRNVVRFMKHRIYRTRTRLREQKWKKDELIVDTTVYIRPELYTTHYLSKLQYLQLLQAIQ